MGVDSININIDLGNAWEMLSAIGTVGAVITSLVLAFKENKPNINATISIGNKFGKFYQLFLTKNQLNSFTLVGFGYYNNFKKRSVNFSPNTHLKVLNSENKKTGYAFPYDFTEENIIKLVIDDAIISALDGKKVRFYVEDINGKIYKSNKVLIRDLSKDV